MIPRVKICGITNLDDALWAVECGADAIGLIFAESPREISVGLAREIRTGLPPFVSAVGVFVDPDPGGAREIVDEVGLDYVQLHRGDEKVFLEESGISPRRLIRSIPIATAADLALVGEAGAGIIHLDTKVEGKAGGTGETFDWDIAARAVSTGKIIMLAGGLTPENVVEAIRIVSPHAVDVSGGVEAAPGKKDHRKIREFIRRAKENVT
jgi:phosphoribosylanthranilate isomerase